MKSILLSVMFALLTIEVAAKSPLDDPNGLIRDAKTAIRVAEAILISVYGEEKVKRGRPYEAQSDGENWYISAKLPEAEDHVNMFGGGYHVTLSRKDCRVIKIGYDE